MDDYGNSFPRESFIGRGNIIQHIEDGIINVQNPINMAIIGLSGTGKTFLVKKITTYYENKLHDKNILPIQLQFTDFREEEVIDFLQFFRVLVDRCVTKMTALKWLTPEIEASANLIPETMTTGLEIKDFFSTVRNAGYNVLFIIDGFDRAREFFNGTHPFQFLRSLAEEDYGLSILLTSRRSIREIEEFAGSDYPYLFNLFSSPIRLGMFSADDLDSYFSEFSKTIPSINQYKDRILFYCGSHPRLLQMLSLKIIDQFTRDVEIDVDKGFDDLKLSFSDFYNNIINFLREQGMLNKLLQILFGPIVDVKNYEVNELESYGLIQIPAKENVYFAYSEHFQDYLRRQEFTAELWPLWSKTEKAFREVIGITLSESEEYGENWIDNLEIHFRNLKCIFDNCRELQEKEEKFSTDSASLDLINFTNPSDLFQIIFVKKLWNSYFACIFGQNKGYWEERNQHITKCRNALAHNRENILDHNQVHQLEEYCNEILEVYEDWSSKR
ncbi:MAG: ATP-binding protein [Candidatus Poribacteria bacterium]|nr:ATP-binding protein [Candidatus Poribacteria bacterium]